MESSSSSNRHRPLSPNLQLYRPQLTSVLSILNRLTGILLSVISFALVIWLVAAATGPQVYTVVQAALASRIGQLIFFGGTFAFFLHFFGGIRHLIWDTVHGFELRAIYMSGWAVVAASIVATVAIWIFKLYIRG